MNEGLTRRAGLILTMALWMVFTACRSTRVATTGSLDENLPARTVIRNYKESEPRFNTLSGRMRIEYKDGDNTQSFNVSLRMERGKAIWISAPLGIVKALVTPSRVTFYNKLQNEYFDGDFTYLSELLGTDLDFEKVQNLLLGQALLDLRDDKYEVSVSGELYELKPKQSAALIKTLFRFEPQNFRLRAQQLSQPSEKRLLEVRYGDFMQDAVYALPQDIAITSIEDTERSVIGLSYRNIEWNKPLNFPYNIPDGFDEILLK